MLLGGSCFGLTLGLCGTLLLGLASGLRGALFLWLFALYLYCRFRGGEDVFTAMGRRPLILIIIWAVFATEMILLAYYRLRVAEPSLALRINQYTPDRIWAIAIACSTVGELVALVLRGKR